MEITSNTEDGVSNTLSLGEVISIWMSGLSERFKFLISFTITFREYLVLVLVLIGRVIVTLLWFILEN